MSSQEQPAQYLWTSVFIRKEMHQRAKQFATDWKVVELLSTTDQEPAPFERGTILVDTHSRPWVNDVALWHLAFKGSEVSQWEAMRKEANEFIVGLARHIGQDHVFGATLLYLCSEDAGQPSNIVVPTNWGPPKLETALPDLSLRMYELTTETGVGTDSAHLVGESLGVAILKIPAEHQADPREFRRKKAKKYCLGLDATLMRREAIGHKIGWLSGQARLQDPDGRLLKALSSSVEVVGTLNRSLTNPKSMDPSLLASTQELGSLITVRSELTRKLIEMQRQIDHLKFFFHRDHQLDELYRTYARHGRNAVTQIRHQRIQTKLMVENLSDIGTLATAQSAIRRAEAEAKAERRLKEGERWLSMVGMGITVAGVISEDFIAAVFGLAKDSFWGSWGIFVLRAVLVIGSVVAVWLFMGRYIQPSHVASPNTTEPEL